MLVLIVLLVIFGLAVLFSSSEYNGRVRFGDSACYFKKQLFATALGMGVMYMVSSIDYHFFLRLGPVAYLISMFLSGAVLFVGQEINGSKRWLNLGPLSFQPSEFAKVAVILFLAWQIERTKKATMGFGFMCRTIPVSYTHLFCFWTGFYLYHDPGNQCDEFRYQWRILLSAASCDKGS